MSQVFDVTVADFADAIEWCHAEGWTDGLPVVPPTEELVARFRDASGWSTDAVLLREPVRGIEVTASAVVVNCVLAGCRPEHLPVVGAVLRAMDHPDFRAHIAVSSTGGPAPVVIVNGPIRDELGMNGSGNLFGPGNRANSSIGRAVRLILRNCLGALPGCSTRRHKVGTASSARASPSARRPARGSRCTCAAASTRRRAR